MGKYSRVDGKKSSGYGLTITIVLIVSLCLVGAWMFMSSWSAPTESIDFSANERTKDVDTTKSDFKSEDVQLYRRPLVDFVSSIAFYSLLMIFFAV